MTSSLLACGNIVYTLCMNGYKNVFDCVNKFNQTHRMSITTYSFTFFQVTLRNYSHTLNNKFTVVKILFRTVSTGPTITITI